MIRLAIALTAALLAAPDFARAQNKSEHSPKAASRFGISVDGVQKKKAKGRKSTGGRKSGGSGPSMNPWLESVQAGQMGGKSSKKLKTTSGKKRKGKSVPTYGLQQAWPKKAY